jgi:hypothetical protein
MWGFCEHNDPVHGFTPDWVRLPVYLKDVFHILPDRLKTCSDLTGRILDEIQRWKSLRITAKSTLFVCFDDQTLTFCMTRLLVETV